MNIACTSLKSGTGLGRAEHPDLAEHRPQEQAGECRADELDDEVPGTRRHGKSPRVGEGKRDGRVEMSSGHRRP